MGTAPRLLLLSALIVLVLDRASKIAVVAWMDLATRIQIDVAPPYLVFRMGWNTGINFGLFGSGSEAMRWALILLALVISAGLGVWAWRAAGWRVPVSAGLVIGGALGNVWDRVQFGAVADFLNMSCCGIQNPYTFNIADVAIFIGAFGLILFGGADKEA